VREKGDKGQRKPVAKNNHLKKIKMTKNLRLLTLSIIAFCSFCNAQNKIKSEIKQVVTSYGPATSVRTILQDRRGDMWFASNEGIIRYDGKSFTNITGNISSDRFFSVLEDRKGNFWFGTYGSGVYYYDSRQPDGQGKSFQHFTTNEGLVSNSVFEIYEDKAGNIWFGTTAGASRYDGKSFRNFTTKEGLYDVTAIIEDKTGKLWFGSSGSTCFYDTRLPNEKAFTVFRDKDGDTVNHVWSIMEDKKGNIWFSGSDGLWRYDGSLFTNFNRNGGLFVYEDKKGNIWNGASNGDGKFALSRYAAASLSDKNPMVTEIAQSLNLFRIFEAYDGSIWFGAYDGVYRYDGNTVTDFKNKAVQK
jgi:ligand-binding sensor domain-containing protein